MYSKTMFVMLDMINRLKGTPIPTQAADVTEGITDSGSTWDSFIELIGLIVLLVIILVAAYYTTRFVGGIKQGQSKNSNFQVIDAYRISPNKVIQIVKIANKYIVVAIGKDTINFITELDESEVYIRDEQTVNRGSFKQILDKIGDKLK